MNKDHIVFLYADDIQQIVAEKYKVPIEQVKIDIFSDKLFRVKIIFPIEDKDNE